MFHIIYDKEVKSDFFAICNSSSMVTSVGLGPGGRMIEPYRGHPFRDFFS